jgi:hypothetical protein
VLPPHTHLDTLVFKTGCPFLLVNCLYNIFKLPSGLCLVLNGCFSRRQQYLKVAVANWFSQLTDNQLMTTVYPNVLRIITIILYFHMGNQYIGYIPGRSF